MSAGLSFIFGSFGLNIAGFDAVESAADNYKDRRRHISWDDHTNQLKELDYYDDQLKNISDKKV